MGEISFRGYVEVLIKNVRIIAVITSLSIIISSVVNFLVLESAYEAKAVLMASSLNSKQQSAQQMTEGIEGFLNTMSQYPQMTIETYKEQINNPQILQQTIDELKLNEKDITRRDLKNMITLNTIKDTNLITITVKYVDKVLAKDIANTIARKFTDFVSQMAKEQATKSSNYIRQQMDIEKENLDNVLLEYKQYIAQPRGLKELQAEFDSKIMLLTKYKEDLLDASIEEQRIRSGLTAAQKQLSVIPDKIALDKSLIEEPFISQVAGDSMKGDVKDTFGTIKVQSEEVNEAYTALVHTVNSLIIELANTTSQKGNLQNEIVGIQKQLETLQVDLAEKQHQDIIIQEKVKFANNTYNAFLEKYEETRIAKSSAIGDASIIIISPAVEPLQPVAPNKKLNIVISTVLGIMMSIFIAFFKEYWRSSVSQN
ncbi:MAG: hypothetical protein APF77_24390 [Clostridia bacterium BRH_c25]|nr:MAG: hypothetical protein APF77_24390 [Clostridia bacterium BRH_c25]